MNCSAKSVNSVGASETQIEKRYTTCYMAVCKSLAFIK